MFLKLQYNLIMHVCCFKELSHVVLFTDNLIKLFTQCTLSMLSYQQAYSKIYWITDQLLVPFNSRVQKFSIWLAWLFILLWSMYWAYTEVVTNYSWVCVCQGSINATCTHAGMYGINYTGIHCECIHTCALCMPAWI